MRIVFVRHAETAANAEGRLQGHAEFNLSETGRAQARTEKTWEETLTQTVETLRRLRDAHGPEAVAGIGESTRDNHAHSIVQVCTPHLILDINSLHSPHIARLFNFHRSGISRFMW